MRAIIKSDGVNYYRILTPFEDTLLRGAMNPYYAILTKAALTTYMRIPELEYLIQHPEIFHPDEQVIDLPRLKIQKKKLVFKERTIPLTKEGVAAVSELAKHVHGVPHRTSVNRYLKRAAIRAGIQDGDRGICMKSYRKTYISWLAEANPSSLMKIAKSAGHTIEVMEKHYAGIFTVRRDIEDIKERVSGWGSA